MRDLSSPFARLVGLERLLSPDVVQLQQPVLEAQRHDEPVRVELDRRHLFFFPDLLQPHALEKVVETPAFVLGSNDHVLVEGLEARACDACSVALELVSRLVLLVLGVERPNTGLAVGSAEERVEVVLARYELCYSNHRLLFLIEGLE